MLAFCLILLRNPVILVPGVLRSKLKVTVDHQVSNWYCKSNTKEHQMWLRVRYATTHLVNCMLDWMTLSTENVNGTTHVVSRPGVNVTTDPWGDVNALRHTGQGFLGSKLHRYLDGIIDDLIDAGWTPGVDLFGASYDWRFGFSEPFRTSFRNNLFDLIIKAWKNTNQKVTLFGHSFGGYQLTEALSDPNFVAKFESLNVSVTDVVHSIVTVGPSWGGTAKMLMALWRKKLPIPATGSWLSDSEKMHECVDSLAGFFLHIPNSVIYNSTVVIHGPNNTAVGGGSAIDTIFKYNKMTETGKKIALDSGNLEYIQRFPRMPAVPMRVIYNSALKTPMGLNVTNWEDDLGEVVFTGGDGTIMAKGVEDVCETWKAQGADIQCVDVKTDSPKFQHTKMLNHVDVRTRLLKWFNADPKKYNDREL